MSKVKTTLSIEKEVFEKGKKHIPNISEFVEECMKQYLGLVDGKYPSSEARDLIETISKTQTELFILNKNYDFEENQKMIENEKQNRPFRALWNDYKRKLTINQQLMNEALNVLPVDAETLEDILDFTYENIDYFNVNFTWEEVYTEYQKEEV